MASSDVTIAALNFTSLSSPSSLANFCAFSIDIWRNIRNLVRFALAMVLGRRRRVLFLVRLKNRRDFSPNSLRLSCNAHVSGDILLSKNRENLELPKSSKANGCGRCSSQCALYRRRNLGELTTHRVQGKNVKQMNSTRFPREPSVSKFAALHKGTIEYASRIAKQSALPPKRKH